MTKIKFRCLSDLTVEAAWDETVLDALLRSGAPVPFFCRSGICGQCKSVLNSGEVLQIGSAPPLLTQEEVAAGQVLICRSVAVTDCEIAPLNLPGSNEEPPWPERVEVVQASWATPTLIHVRLAAASGTQPSTFLFHPGQYSRVQRAPTRHEVLPGRLYPSTRPGLRILEFYISAKSPAQASALAAAFCTGATLELAKPVGASCLKEGERGPVVLASTSEGLPAVLSMLELLRLGEDRGRVRVAVLGNQEDHLERQVAALCSDAGIDLQFSNRDDMRAVLERATAAVIRSPCTSGPKPRAYVKGDEALVRLSREIFYARGFRPWDVHTEIIEGAVPAL
jgi:ferredoxin/ferredoxin-NADP reductase